MRARTRAKRQRGLGKIGVLITLLLAGCGQTGTPEQPGTLPDESYANVSLDPEMDAATQARVKSDLSRILEMRVMGGRIRYFSDAFGGTGSDDVARYIDERVHYILPRGTNWRQRVVVVGATIPSEELEAPDDEDILAQNAGTSLWYIREMIRPGTLRVRFAGGLIPVESTRVGIVALGAAYSGDTPQMTRVATQVHEARHSDCTGGLTQADLARASTGADPQNIACGHLHADCPADHPLAGLPACDGHAWGAYAIEMLHSVAVSETCTDCSRSQREAARVTALDAASRILQLDALLSGELGKPDMSSAGVVGE